MRTPQTRDKPYTIEEALLEHIRKSVDFKALVSRLKAENTNPDRVKISYLMRPPETNYDIVYEHGVGWTRAIPDGYCPKKLGRQEEVNDTLKEFKTQYDGENKLRRCITRGCPDE